MNGIDTLISTVSGAIGGGITGAIAAFVGWRTLQHTVKRDEFQDFFSSYKEDIANQEKSVAEAEGGPDKDEKQRTLARLREEFHVAQGAWRQKQNLAKLVPQGAITAGEPKLAAEEIAHLVELLEGSARLPPALLSADDYFIRGGAYYEATDYEQALEAYNRALELRPDHPATLYNRGVTLGRMGRYKEALKDFNRALELRPDHPDTLYNRGLTLHNMGRYEDAIKDYNRALELRPDDPTTVYNRACAYSMWGKFEEALHHLEAAVKGNEKSRQMAKTDEDFKNLRDAPEYGPRFRKLVGEE